MHHMTNHAPLVGRIFLAVIFIVSGISKVTSFDQTVGFIASRGLPIVGLLTVLVILVEVLGSIALLIGFQARKAAVALLVFLALATLLYHMDWSKQMEMMNFLKNLAIMGGLLYVSSFGPGAMSVDKR